MKNLRKYRFQLLNILIFLSIPLTGCRSGSTIRIINSTVESLEVTFYPIDAIDTLYSLKKAYGDSIAEQHDTIFQKIKKEFFRNSNPTIGNIIKFREMYHLDDKESFVNVKDDLLNGSRSFTILPKSEVDLIFHRWKTLIDIEDSIFPYVGKIIIQYKGRELINAEKKEVVRLFKYKSEVAVNVYYLDIKQKDLKAYSKTPRTE